MHIYNIDRVLKFIEEHNLEVMHVTHDDFTRHETYVVARADENTFYSIIYVAPDDLLEYNVSETAAEAMFDITTSSLATYLTLTKEENDYDSALALSNLLRDYAKSSIRAHLMQSSAAHCIETLAKL